MVGAVHSECECGRIPLPPVHLLSRQVGPRHSDPAPLRRLLRGSLQRARCHKGHDHLFGSSGPGRFSGNDLLDTRDGENERGEIEEVHGADGLDRCFLDPDPDGVKFSGCEYLNGRKSPYPTDKYVNTSDEGNQTDRRAEVNQFLRGN